MRTLHDLAWKIWRQASVSIFCNRSISYFASHSVNNIVVIICGPGLATVHIQRNIPRLRRMCGWKAKLWPIQEFLQLSGEERREYVIVIVIVKLWLIQCFCSSAVRIEENNLKSKWILVISLSYQLSLIYHHLRSEIKIFSGTKVLRTAGWPSSRRALTRRGRSRARELWTTFAGDDDEDEDEDDGSDGWMDGFTGGCL